jgi:hypothetical protein
MIEVKSSMLRRGQGSGVAYLQWAHRQLKDLWRDAINAFIFEAMFAMQGPDTGMSRGQLLPLAGELNIRSQAKAVAQTGAKVGFRGVFDPQGNWRPQIMRNISTGAKQGRNAYKISYGTHTNAKFGFEFNLQVWQSKLYEDQSYYGHGPVHAMRAGGRAFNAYLDEHAHEYLPVEAFIHFIRTGRPPATSVLFRSFDF